MWILFGTEAKTKRVPGGARVERTCGSCGETAMFYERDALTTFQLYTLDVFDYGHRRVMACGACGAHYATDEVRDAGASSKSHEKREGGEAGERKGLLAEGVRAARNVGGLLDRAAEAVEARVSSLMDGDARADARGAPAPGVASRSRTSAPVRDEDLSDDDRDALEGRFRELEARAAETGDPRKARFRG